MSIALIHRNRLIKYKQLKGGEIKKKITHNSLTQRTIDTLVYKSLGFPMHLVIHI